MALLVGLTVTNFYNATGRTSSTPECARSSTVLANLRLDAGSRGDTGDRIEGGAARFGWLAVRAIVRLFVGGHHNPVQTKASGEQHC